MTSGARRWPDGCYARVDAAARPRRLQRRPPREAGATLDAIQLYDISVDPPKLIAQRNRGKKLVIDDPLTYAALRRVAAGDS